MASITATAAAVIKAFRKGDTWLADRIYSGVPAGMIWTEDRSKSTYENALFSAEILRAKGITRIALVGSPHSNAAG
jgi:uncharacterized SAM-binding protein YcdF (DUF218 family)